MYNPKIILSIAWKLLPVVALLLGYHLLFWDRIYPGVKVAGVALSGNTQAQSQEKIANAPRVRQVILASESQNFSFLVNNLGITYDDDKTMQEAFGVGRRGNIIETSKQKLQVILGKTNLPLAVTLDEAAFDKTVSPVATQLAIPAITPGASIEKGEVLVNPGQNGREIDTQKLKELILANIEYGKEDIIVIPTKTIEVELTTQEVGTLKTKAEALVGKKISVTFEKQTFDYKDNDLVELLTPSGFSQDKLSHLASNIAQGVNRDPQNAKFEFEGGRVKEFTPAKDGIEVQEEELVNMFVQEIEKLQNLDEKDLPAGKVGISFALPVKSTKPDIATEDVNDLGIKELIGQGTSRFKGSIPGRVHNIALATNRINGILIKPGGVFSFNKALGDVSVFTGYQQAYIIKEGRTILGDGGGVCQVSTTFFRAALNGGLPISERHAHSYRVSYYEHDSKPGLDATVYDPTADLRIKNDTGAHVLIQAKVDRKNMTLVFELYGTSDGRVATISTPKVWDVQPAPPALYQDDPTLPAGQTKQVDFAAAGSKASFNYKVVRGEEVLQSRTFYSNYRPWQAVYLRGTQ